MCLTKLKKFVPTEKNIGYKWVEKSKKGYTSPNDGSYTYKENEWNEAIDKGQSKMDYGFHIFDNLKEAQLSAWGRASNWYRGKNVLLKVQYKYFHTGIGDGRIGDEDKSRMIVAKQMKILEEVG